MVDTSIVFDLIARDRASSSILRVGRSADSSKSKLIGMAAKGAVAFGVVATAAAVFAYKVGSDYVGSLNKIQALTGANDATMTKAAKTLESNSGLYAKMGQTTGDAAAGVVELTKAGLSLHDSLHAVNATMVLAKAGELSVADASTLVANSLNTFGLKAKDAGKIANQLANAANISSADVSDLAESFKYVSPVAASAGVSMGQVNAILAELSNSGIKASQAGTTLRTFLLNLQAPAGAAAAVIDALGINVYDATGKMKPLGDVIEQVGGKLNGLSQQEKNADLKLIFGKTGIAGATTILNAGKAGLDKYTKGVNRAGAASKLAEANSKGLAGTLATLKANVTSTAQELYRRFSPYIDDAIHKLGDLVSKIRDEAVPRIKEFADKFVEKLPEIEQFIRKIRDNLNPSLENLKRAFRRSKPAVVDFTSAIKDAAGPLKKLTSDVLIQTSKLNGKSSPAWVNFGRIVGIQVVNYFANWIRTVGQVATGLDAFGRHIGSIIGILGNLGGKFVDAGKKAAQFAGSIGGRIKSAVGNLGSILYAAGGQAISGLVSGMIDTARTKMTSALHTITSMIPLHKGPIDKDRVLLQPAGVAIMEGLIAGIRKGETPLKSALARVTDYISKQRDKLNSLLSAKAGFAQGFQAFTTSVFSTDLSKTTTDADGNDTTTPATVQDMLAYQKRQRAKARRLRNDVKKLHKMGLSDALIRQLQASGESGAAQIHTLAGGTKADIRRENRLDKQTRQALAQAGGVAAGQLYDRRIVQVKNNEDLAKRIAGELRKMDHHGKDEYVVIELNGHQLIRAVKKTTRHQGKKTAGL